MRTPCSVGKRHKNRLARHRGHLASPSGTMSDNYTRPIGLLEKEYELERVIIKEAINIVKGCDDLNRLEHAVERYLKFRGIK